MREGKDRILIMGFGGVLESGKMLYNKLSSLYSFEGRQMVLRIKCLSQCRWQKLCYNIHK